MGGNVINLTLKGNKSRCPRCGNFADIPDAVLNSYDGAVEVLQSSTYSEYQITKFFSILQKTYSDLQDNKPVSLSNTVESLEDNIPFLAALLPSLSNKAELYTFIGLLLSIIMLVQSFKLIVTVFRQNLSRISLVCVYVDLAYLVLYVVQILQLKSIFNKNKRKLILTLN